MATSRLVGLLAPFAVLASNFTFVRVAYARHTVGYCLGFVDDCGGTPDDHTDNSDAFERCFQLASKQSGCIVVEPGTYYSSGAILNVSNVNVLAHRGVVLRPWHGITKSEGFFRIGQPYQSTQAQLVQNVTIAGLLGDGMHEQLEGHSGDSMISSGGEVFTMDASIALVDPWKMPAVSVCGWVQNFTIANMRVLQANPDVNQTARYPNQLAALNFNQDHDADGNRSNPTDGVIENITTVGGTWGYGAVQVRSGERLRFRNIDGTGGITLRLESGGGGDEYIDQVLAENVTCRYGDSALMTEPHVQRNGVFHATGLQSVGCSATVLLNGGYSQRGLPPGHFSNDSTVSGVTSAYGHPGWAQWSKNQHNASACAACIHENSNMNYEVAVSGVTTKGYPAPANRTTCIYANRNNPCPL